MIIIRTTITNKGLEELLWPVVQQFFILNTQRIHLLYLLHKTTFDIFSKESPWHVLVDLSFATFVAIKLPFSSQWRHQTGTSINFYITKWHKAFRFFGKFVLFSEKFFFFTFPMNLHFFSISLHFIISLHSKFRIFAYSAPMWLYLQVIFKF